MVTVAGIGQLRASGALAQFRCWNFAERRLAVRCAGPASPVAAGMDASAETDRAFIPGEQPVWRRTLSHGKAKLVTHAERMRLC